MRITRSHMGSLLAASCLLLGTSASAEVITGNSTYVRSNAATTNYASSSLIVGGAGGTSGSGLIHTLLAFDLSSIPSGSVISSPTLGLWVNAQDGSNNSTTPVDFELHELTGGGFVESQATWNIRATGTPWATGGGDFSATILSAVTINTEAYDNFPTGQHPGVIGTQFTWPSTVDFTQAVQNAVTNSQTLYMVLLAPAAETGGSSNRHFMFFYDDDTGGALQPRLVFAIPEPSTLALLATGALGGLLGLSSRRVRRHR